MKQLNVSFKSAKEAEQWIIDARAYPCVRPQGKNRRGVARPQKTHCRDVPWRVRKRRDTLCPYAVLSLDTSYVKNG